MRSYLHKVRIKARVVEKGRLLINTVQLQRKTLDAEETNIFWHPTNSLANTRAGDLDIRKDRSKLGHVLIGDCTHINC